MSALVWFSGISAVNLVDVIPYDSFEEYACNHFDEFRSVQHLVSYDRQMVANRQLKQDITYWTQPKWKCHGWQAVTWNRHTCAISDSGTLAIEAALQQHQHVYVIGCDWSVTDQSMQDHHYTFRGYSPPKFTKQLPWIQQRSSYITWVHLIKQPWMLNWMHHSDFLDLATSSRH